MRVLELFAGGGGMALGLEMAGFEAVGLVEKDRSAVGTLKKNRPGWNVIEGDIKEVVEGDLEEMFGVKEGELDLLSGGYPCQAFSYAGKGRGIEDTRGTLFYGYARFLELLKPRMFLVENVKGLVSHDKGRTLSKMLSVFEGVGYKAEYKVLNAVDYEVGQKREREGRQEGRKEDRKQGKGSEEGREPEWDERERE